MSSKQPDIKFSPFEALLIGEKNKVLKRQPTKNSIFVTRLHQKSRTVNLRALFGLDKSSHSSKSNDDIFKMPQRVHEYLNNKRHSYEGNKITENKEKEDIVYNEFKETKMLVKSNDSAQYKKSNIKSKKVKFKEKFNRDGNEKVVNNVQDALKNHSAIKKSNLNKRNGGMSNVVSRENGEDRCSATRYELRGKDSKFICQTEYECLQSKEVDSKINQENYVCKIFMDNNKNIFDNGNQIKNDNLNEFQMPNLIGDMVDMEQSELSDPEILSNELSEQNYYCQGDFEFPKCPETEISDFDNDENLVDIIYENFPKSFNFESEDSSHDFIDALVNANIIEPGNDLEIYITKENLEEDENLKVSSVTQTSSMDLPKSIDLSSCYHVRTVENDYITTADGFVAIQNHLITDENFGRLFINDSDHHNKNDLIMAKLMKPLIHNSWVRSLKNF